MPSSWASAQRPSPQSLESTQPAGMQVAFSVRAFLIGCGDAFVLFLMMLGVIVQRPAPE